MRVVTQCAAFALLLFPLLLWPYPVATGEPAPSVRAPTTAGKATKPVTLTDLRFRSYKHYTRVVIEATGPFTHRLESSTNREARVVLHGLSVKAAESQTVSDGLLKSIQLATSPSRLRIAFQGQPGETRTYTLQEPYRLVLEFYRTRGNAEPVKAPQGEPLRVIALDAGEEGPQRISLGEIARARLEVDWEAEFRKPEKPAGGGPGPARKGGHGR